MAAPSIVSGSLTTTTRKATSFTVNLPSPMTSGNLVMIVGGWRDGALPVTLTTSGWTKVVLAENDSNNTASASFWYREVNGTEGSNVSFTMDSDREATFHAFEVSGWDTTTAPTGTGFDYNSTKTASPNPPSHSWAWSSDTLVISGFAFRGNETVTANPTGYTLFADANNSGSAKNRIDIKDVTSSPEDPSAYSTSSDSECVAFTIAIPSAAAGGTDNLTADDVESASEVTSPSIGQEHGLTATSAQATSEVTAPAIGQTHVLTAEDVESASEVSTPALSITSALAADDVEAASEVSAPALGQIHQIGATSVEAASEVTAPTLAIVAGTPLQAEDVEAASEVTAPALGQVHVLTAVSIEAASEVTQPAINGATARRRGGGIPTTRGRKEFWEEEAERWIAEQLQDLPKVAKRSRKKRQAFVQDFLSEAQAVTDSAPQVQPIIDRIEPFLRNLTAPKPDYGATAAIMAEVQRFQQEEQTRRRRKRDVETVLILAA